MWNFLFYLNFFKKLEYNCFTMLCQFLLYNNRNQLYVYICLLPLGLPPPSWTTSRSSESIELGSLCYRAASHWLFILHIVVYIFQCYSPNLSHPVLPPLHPPASSTSPFFTSVSLFLPCKQVHQYHFFQIPYIQHVNLNLQRKKLFGSEESNF